MTNDTKNTLVKGPQKPIPAKPQIPRFQKPNFNNLPKFTQAFRNQNRGSGGK